MFRLSLSAFYACQLQLHPWHVTRVLRITEKLECCLLLPYLVNYLLIAGHIKQDFIIIPRALGLQSHRLDDTSILDTSC